MKNLAILIVTTPALAFSVAAFAGGNICAPSNAVGFDGIGDGCSTSVAGYVFPDIAVFRGTFTPACNSHDKCYTTLGTTYGECNGNFIADMRSACRSSFNPIFLPAEYAACNSSALNYYSAVAAWASAKDPLPQLQNDALNRSRSMQNLVNADVCGTTPESTTLYSAGLINQINSAFQSNANRLPTVYEFFDAVNSGSIVGDRSGWDAMLVSKSTAAASIIPPAAGFTSEIVNFKYVFTARPITPGVSYLWKANNVSATATTFQMSLKNPKYDLTWAIEGFVKATNSAGQRSMQVINIPVYEAGWCSNRPGIACF